MTSSDPITITLIHGTWGRGLIRHWLPYYPYSSTRWFEPQSKFRIRLEEELRKNEIDAVIETFDWSGENSLRARERGAIELAATIRGRPNRRHILVGHSHGGNVAIGASTKLNEIDHLLITLSTPFIRASSIKDKKYIERLRRCLMVADIVAAIVFLALAQTVARWFNWSVVSAIIAFLSVMGFGIYLRKTLSSIGTRRIAAALRIQDFANKRVKMLVLRTPNDEANLAIAAASIGTQFTKFLLKWSDRLLLFGLPSLVVVSFISLLFFEARTGADPLWDTLVVPMGLLLLTLPLVLITLVVIGAVFHTANGAEFYFGGFLYDLDVVNSPDTHDGVEVRTLRVTEDTSSGLRHSIYSHPECAAACASWIQESIKIP